MSALSFIAELKVSEKFCTDLFELDSIKYYDIDEFLEGLRHKYSWNISNMTDMSYQYLGFFSLLFLAPDVCLNGANMKDDRKKEVRKVFNLPHAFAYVTDIDGTIDNTISVYYIGNSDAEEQFWSEIVHNSSVVKCCTIKETCGKDFCKTITK